MRAKRSLESSSGLHSNRAEPKIPGSEGIFSTSRGLHCESKISKLKAIKTSGRVYLWDTIEQLNLKAKNMRDLVSDEEFTRSDLIILQDPMDLDRQNISTFKNQQEDQTKPETDGKSAAEGMLNSSLCRSDSRQNLEGERSCRKDTREGQGDRHESGEGSCGTNVIDALSAEISSIQCRSIQHWKSSCIIYFHCPRRRYHC